MSLDKSHGVHRDKASRELSVLPNPNRDSLGCVCDPNYLPRLSRIVPRVVLCKCRLCGHFAVVRLGSPPSRHL